VKVEIELSKINHDFLVAVAEGKQQTISEAIADAIDCFAGREAQTEPLAEIQGGFQGILEEMRQLLTPASLKVLAAEAAREAKK